MNKKEKRYTLTRYLFGALPARLGDEMSSQVILLTGLALTQTAVLGSTVLAALTISAALGGPLLGAVIDRSSHPGRVLAWALGLYAIGIACIALSFGHVPVLVSVVIALSAGFLMPAISGGWSSRLKTFIADEKMTRASAVDVTTFNIAGLGGPAVAGMIAALWGVHWAAIVLIVLLLAALPMAWSLPRRKDHKKRHDISFVQDVVSGFKIIIHNKSLLRITATSVISYMGIGMLWVIYPLIGRDLFGNAGYGGILASIVSIGALVATLGYAKWPTRHSPDSIAFITTIILSIALLLLAFTGGSVILPVLAMLIIGLADGPQLAAIFAVRHREAPERLRSQVFTTGASLKITAAAAGAALAGQLATGSLQVTILIACLVQVVAAVAFVLLTGRIAKK